MSFFNVSITGLETIEKDLNEELKEITNLSNLALSNLGVEMIETLQKFIQKRFYDLYKPRVYQRRSEHDGLGTPIIDKSNMHPNVKGTTLEFDFIPNLEHKKPKWTNNHTYNGVKTGHYNDYLIKWARIGVNCYTGENMGPRPFWNEFLEEEEQTIFDYYKNAMLPYSVIRDNTDVLDLSEFEE